MTADQVSCVACGETDWIPLLHRDGFRYVECRTCATARLDPLPEESALAAVFGKGYFTGGSDVGGYADYAADEPLHRANAADRVRRLRRAAVLAGPIVDVGCASGESMTAMRQAGWRPFGVEISATMAAAARERRFEVRPRLDDYLPDLGGTCAAVTFFQSLEHMRDPAGALQLARRLLRPDGYVIIETWDRASPVARLMRSSWQQVSPPSVVWMFHRGAAARMASSAGLRLRSWRTSRKKISVRWGLSLVAAKHPAGRAALERCAASPIGGLTVPYRLGDLVTAVMSAEPPSSNECT